MDQVTPRPEELEPGIDRVLVPMGWRLWGRMAGWAGVWGSTMTGRPRITLRGKGKSKMVELAQMLADGRATIVREH